MSEPITVHPLSQNPSLAWECLSKTQKVLSLDMESPENPVDENSVRFVCMSDTHCLTAKLPFEIPNGDIFIHAGDFTQFGKKEEVIEFNHWLKSLPHKYKVVICGNHELSFDSKFSNLFAQSTANSSGFFVRLHELYECYANKPGNSDSTYKQYLTDCIYLEDSSVELFGIHIYGSPWQPEFGGWAFNTPRGAECLSKWNLIPDNTDVLITHGPPLGHGDMTRSGVRAGCTELLATVQKRVRPKYHIFGHIHEGYGVTSDGETTYINASTCTKNYIAKNPPIVFDMPLPGGKTKD